MPLKIFKGRKAKSPNLYIRGSYLGVAVDQSTKTDRHSVAKNILKLIEREIESGEFEKVSRSPTFLEASIGYLQAGGASDTSPS